MTFHPNYFAYYFIYFLISYIYIDIYILEDSLTKHHANAVFLYVYGLTACVALYF